MDRPDKSKKVVDNAKPVDVTDVGDDFASGHDKMLAILERVKERAPYEFPFFGQQMHVKTRREFENLSPNAPLQQKIDLLQRLGFQELLYEETPRLAIDHLTEAFDILSQTAEIGSTTDRIESQNETAFYLAVAWLRQGEVENCCSRNTSESCILPIRGEGVHAKEIGSRQAIKYFQHVLKNARMEKSSQRTLAIDARWLMNIAYMTLGEYPTQVPKDDLIPPEYFNSEVDFPSFENVAPKLGLNTYNHAGGAIVDDFDNDDYLDILTSSSNPSTQTRFFRNNRDGTFTDYTKEAGLTGICGGLNIVQADFNNDGNLDVLILRGAWHGKYGKRPNSLLRNNGNATFTDVTFDAGLGEVHYPTKTAAWADYDNDGDLDLYIGNEHSSEYYAPGQLFRNNGNSTFTDVGAQAGLQPRVFSMGTVWGDIDNDRYPDLFLAGRSLTDQNANRLFHNNQDGTFTDIASKLGMVPKQRSFPFPVWFWDYNNDGALDLYVSASNAGIGLLTLDALNPEAVANRNGVVQGRANLGYPNSRYEPWVFDLPSLYHGNGDGTMVDVAADQNLNSPTEPMGANFGDINGDGFLDFYLATGNVGYWILRPNIMFLNNEGRGFSDVTMGGGFGHLQKGHGVSFADIDNDGDQDIYVQMGGQLPGDKYYDSLFQNPGFGHHWITIKLVGKTSNTSAIGARIHVTISEDGTPRSIYRHVNSGGSFGCNPLQQNIGLRMAEKIDSIEVYWPTSDTTQVFRDVKMDQTIRITEGENSFQTIKLKTLELGRKK
ncbi:MAG: CRTAC1 family protein [Planctomycetota bacterium]|nr:CRTAC1 family protein [Planctomycetota bacterium]MDA1211016.1 CRTAC1 family protein [Planctomycetota bacterium]